MDTFLELPLDREFYQPKKKAKREKPPLRVLITEAGSKTAHKLMYKICSGQVFGPDQPVILHLVNAKGCVSHKATLLELNECGFSALTDSVVSSEPEKTYGKVDVVILIALFEQLSGHNMPNSFLCQLNKTRNVARNMRMFSKPNAKIVVCSPSTKGVVILLTSIRIFEPEIDVKNISGVVFLDEVVDSVSSFSHGFLWTYRINSLSKNLTAKQLRTTTDNIKNLTIWGTTFPDLHNATVFMYPPEDKARLSKTYVPVMEALEDQNWVQENLIPSIYKRTLMPGLLRHGMAMASAVARHLKLLFQGTDSTDEIVSMAVIIPPDEPYGFNKDLGFALPVVTKNGEVTVRQGVECDITTHLMNLRSLYNVQNESSMRVVYNLIKYIEDYEEATKKEFLWNQHTYLTKRGNYSFHFFRYIISPRHSDTAPLEDGASKKSIVWEEVSLLQTVNKRVKSALQYKL